MTLLSKQHLEVEVSSSSGSLNSSYKPKSFPPGKLEESDDDLFMVPDVEAQTEPGTKNNHNNNNDNNNIQELQNQTGKRRRSRNSADKEFRRHKRLLRNRVSAQQARERKKVYVIELESRAMEMQDRNAKIQEKISTLVNENTMLRKVLLNTRPKADEHAEPTMDLLGK